MQTRDCIADESRDEWRFDAAADEKRKRKHNTLIKENYK